MAEEKYISLEEMYLFNHGKFFHSDLKLGAHKIKLNNRIGVHFALWAPSAKRVYVVGDFNNWQGNLHEMDKQGETGCLALFIPELEEGCRYKYEIETCTGERFLKADPFAFFAECRPNTASIVYSLEGYTWQDSAWLTKREKCESQKKPLLIYEVHLGSWKRRPDQAFYSYRDLADELVAYVQEMGFTHIEFLPLMEHPYDGSWGYQITGFYAATSRYGTPHDLMYLIDRCHQAGIAVIFDWVPGHFCKDAHGLASFDGSWLFEQEEHLEWGTLKFDFSRREVWSFLISNALFWFRWFHIDGLRVDGVTSMLLLNYGKGDQSWVPNIHGGNENLEAIAFLQELNRRIFEYHPYALMIAEESTDWPFVTKPPYDGGLGFNYKWNMGWMNDTLNYFQGFFPSRSSQHHLLTFSLVYAFSENFILPFSHDEVVHGKKSLLDKMPGNYEQKFAGLRLLYLYQICHPGKKLLFMGGELAQFREWCFDSALEWFLLDFEMHRKYKEYVKTLNHLYLQERSLWEIDHDWQGFEWIDVHNYTQSILIFLRKASEDEDFLIIVLNLQSRGYEEFRVGVPASGYYQELFNSDLACFGGTNKQNTELIMAQPFAWQGRKYSISIKLPPLTGIIIKPV